MNKSDILQASRKFFEENHGTRVFEPGVTYIPPSGKVLDADDCANLVDASLDMWLTAGRYPFDAVRIAELCRLHDLYLIEDCCDAFGAKLEGKGVGTFGDLATLSFYPAHHITMGEGGAVLMDSIRLARITESFRDWGRDCYCKPGCDNTCGKRFEWQLGDLPEGYDHKYIYSHIGYNLKVSDMQAAIGCSQLDKLDRFIAKRNANFDGLTRRIKVAGLEEYLHLPEATPNSEPSWFGYPRAD